VKEVIMPKMGLSMEAGKIEEWKKKEGEKVEEGEILFVLSTEKISLEIEAFDSGYLRKIIAGEGEEVPVSEVIAYIGELDEPLPGEITQEKAYATKTFESKIKISKTIPLSGIRKVISEKMTYSMQNIPHIMQTIVVNAENLITLREKINLKVENANNARITYTDFFIKASAILLTENPAINSSFQDNMQVIYEQINVSIGISAGAGLMVATIYDADKKNIYEIAEKRNEIVEKAKKNNLSLEDISNATFTISNLGMYGIRSFTALINPPMAAILMIGEIYKSAVESEGNMAFKRFMDISMAVDHRILDGTDSARYLNRLREVIEEPEILLN